MTEYETNNAYTYLGKEITEKLQRLVDEGLSGTDILHGQLKNDIYEAEKELEEAQRVEDETEEAIDSMERKYWEGQLDALEYVYKMTYVLALAIDERTKARG